MLVLKAANLLNYIRKNPKMNLEGPEHGTTAH